MDRMENMYDLRLKPRLLLSVIRDRLPDEKHPLPDPSQLSSLLSLVRVHGLLKESVHGTKTDKKLIQEWKSAVDSWVDHVFSLASSNMPDKRWVGVGLLGLTCEECHSYRFLAFYSDWAHKILEIIQLPGGSYFTAVAACSSLSDLLIRLSEFTHLKKDAASLAGKIIQPILQMLNEDASDALWVAAVDLLCTVTTFFSFTVRRHYDKELSATSLPPAAFDLHYGNDTSSLALGIQKTRRITHLKMLEDVSEVRKTRPSAVVSARNHFAALPA